MPPNIDESILMPHQREGVDWLKENKRGLLAFAPGLGKTLTVLMLIKETGINSLPALIIAPRGLLGVWVAEAEKYMAFSVIPITGTGAERKKRLEEKHSVYVIGYEMARIMWKELSMIEWGLIALDESGKVRTPTAKVSKVIHSFRARYKVALDGTPISNSIADLWNVCTWLDRTCLYGNFYRFRAIHAIMNPYIPGKVEAWRGEKEIMDKTKHLIMWRGKETLTDLPPLTEQDVPVEMETDEIKELKKMKEEMVAIVKNELMPITNALVLLLRMRQYIDGVEQKKSSKLTALRDLLDALAPESKAIIFCAFKATARRLLEEMRDEAVLIDGDTSQEERDVALALFKESNKVRWLIGTSAMSKGYNIQCADVIIHYDLPWSFAMYDQQIGRAWRNGQEKHVHVYNLVAEKTIEKKIRKILAGKQSLAESLSRRDLAELLDIPT